MRNQHEDVVVFRGIEHASASPVAEDVENDGPAAGLAELATVDPGLPRHTAASAYLHEEAGDLPTAARLYAEAARSAATLAERHHLTRQAARISRVLRG